MVDRQHPVAGPSGALRASKIAPGDFVAALYFSRAIIPATGRSVLVVSTNPILRIREVCLVAAFRHDIEELVGGVEGIEAPRVG